MRLHRTLFSLKLTMKWRLLLLALTAAVGLTTFYISWSTFYISWSASASSRIALRPRTLLIYNNEHLCSSNTSLVNSYNNYPRRSTVSSTTPSETSIVIVVPSRRKNVMQRHLIRQTYGSVRKVNNVHILAVVFMLGSVDDPKDSKTEPDELDAERRRFGDVIMGDLVDSYRNLSRKSIMAYDWLTSYCREADLLVKTDDDVVVDIFKLTAELGKWTQTELESLKFWCGVHNNEKVNRDRKSIYYVSRKEYSHKKFPKHCAGVGYVTSMHLVRRIADEVAKSFTGSICSHEDAFLTGIVPEEINSRAGKPTVYHVNKKKDWVFYVDEHNPNVGGQYIWKVVGEPIHESVDFGEFRNQSGTRVFYLLQQDSNFKIKFLRLWHLLENSFRSGEATIQIDTK